MFLTGIHYIGEMAERTLTRLYLDQLTEGQLVWDPIDKNFDTVVIGEGDNKKFFDMVSGDRKSYRASLIKMFPEEEEAIDKFLFQLKVLKVFFFSPSLFHWTGALFPMVDIHNHINESIKRDSSVVVQNLRSSFNLWVTV